MTRQFELRPQDNSRNPNGRHGKGQNAMKYARLPQFYLQLLAEWSSTIVYTLVFSYLLPQFSSPGFIILYIPFEY